MKLQSVGLVFSLSLALGFVAFSCSSGDTVGGGSGGGNTNGSAGSNGGGNTTGKAGTTGTGNTTGQAGTTGGGNTTGRAGTTGTGNTTGIAGTTGTGNTTGLAGTTGTGNTTGTAGTTGNTTGTAGTTGTGCGTSFQASTGGWVTMPAKTGCWAGYAFDFTETPVCGSTITPANFATCTATCALTASGMVGTATAANSYCAVVGIGFNINQAMGATTASTLAPTGTGIMVSFSETAGTLPFRVQLRDDSTSTGYCFNATTSPVMIPYGSFNTKCYDTPADGTPYGKTPFTSVQILIAGGAAATAFTMGITSVSEY